MAAFELKLYSTRWRKEIITALGTEQIFACLNEFVVILNLVSHKVYLQIRFFFYAKPKNIHSRDRLRNGFTSICLVFFLHAEYAPL